MAEYNTERPHDALQQATPASWFTASPRPYPMPLPAIEYPLHFLVKKVTDAGTFRFQHRLLYLANSLVDEHIGLEESDDDVWAIYFNTVLLATLDERDHIIRGSPHVAHVLGELCYPSSRLLRREGPPSARANS